MVRAYTFQRGPTSLAYGTNVCGKLVNSTECHDLHCRDKLIHDPEIIQWWKTNKKAKEDCDRGRSCTFNGRGVCLYRHSFQNKTMKDRLQIHMMKGVEHECLIRLEALTSAAPARIQGLLELSSFNRLGNNEIAVPGAPARFSPLKRRVSIPQDCNNSKLKDYPIYTYRFEPLLRSLEVMQPHFDLFGADIVCNVTILDRLFKFLNYPSDINQRFDMEWHENTLFISRWLEPKGLQFSSGRGTGFEQMTCKFDHNLQQSTSHHRVHFYSFGGLNCVVQSEVDSYMCRCHPLPTSEISPKPPKPPKPCVTNRFQQLALNDPGDGTNCHGSSSSMKIRHVGRHVPLGCLLELKTRKIGSRYQNNPCYDADAQLYFSRQTQLLTAFYQDTEFEPGSPIQDKTRDIMSWEEREQKGLGKLVALLNEVIQLAKDAAETRGLYKTAIVFKYDTLKKNEAVYSLQFCRREGEGFIPPF